MVGSHILGGSLNNNYSSGVIIASSATLDFAINQRKTTDETIISDLAMLSGATYTITVEGLPVSMVPLPSRTRLELIMEFLQ